MKLHVCTLYQGVFFAYQVYTGGIHVVNFTVMG